MLSLGERAFHVLGESQKPLFGFWYGEDHNSQKALKWFLNPEEELTVPYEGLECLGTYILTILPVSNIVHRYFPNP